MSDNIEHLKANIEAAEAGLAAMRQDLLRLKRKNGNWPLGDVRNEHAITARKALTGSDMFVYYSDTSESPSPSSLSSFGRFVGYSEGANHPFSVITHLGGHNTTGAIAWKHVKQACELPFPHWVFRENGNHVPSPSQSILLCARADGKILPPHVTHMSITTGDERVVAWLMHGTIQENNDK